MDNSSVDTNLCRFLLIQLSTPSNKIMERIKGFVITFTYVTLKHIWKKENGFHMASKLQCFTHHTFMKNGIFLQNYVWAKRIILKKLYNNLPNVSECTTQRLCCNCCCWLLPEPVLGETLPEWVACLLPTSMGTVTL